MRFFIAILSCFFMLYGSAHAQEAPPLASSQPADSGMDTIDDIPLAYIQEAEMFQQYCGLTNKMRRHYNCECLASRFLEVRLSLGPTVTRSYIVGELENDCQDASEAAATQYSMCIGNTLLIPRGVAPDAYCRCFANEFAKIFENHKLSLSPRVISNVQSEAHVRCQTDDLAQRSYGQEP